VTWSEVTWAYSTYRMGHCTASLRAHRTYLLIAKRKSHLQSRINGIVDTAWRRDGCTAAASLAAKMPDLQGLEHLIEGKDLDVVIR